MSQTTVLWMLMMWNVCLWQCQRDVTRMFEAVAFEAERNFVLPVPFACCVRKTGSEIATFKRSLELPRQTSSLSLQRRFFNGFHPSSYLWRISGVRLSFAWKGLKASRSNFNKRAHFPSRSAEAQLCQLWKRDSRSFCTVFAGSFPARGAHTHTAAVHSMDAGGCAAVRQGAPG